MTPAVDARHYRTATGRRPPFNLANYMSAELSANIAYRLFNQKAVGRFSVTVVLATAITSGNSSSSRDGMTAETSPTRHRSSSIAEDSTVYGQVWRSVILAGNAEALLLFYIYLYFLFHISVANNYNNYTI